MNEATLALQEAGVLDRTDDYVEEQVCVGHDFDYELDMQ